MVVAVITEFFSGTIGTINGAVPIDCDAVMVARRLFRNTEYRRPVRRPENDFQGRTPRGVLKAGDRSYRLRRTT